MTVAWEWSATGTRWRIHHGGTIGPATARRAAELVEADEARWSRFRPDSEVTRLTRAAGRSVRVSPETLALLAACVRWRRRSRGIFEPLVGRALTEWGYARSLANGRPGVTQQPAPRRVSGEIELDRSAGTARIPDGSELDVGGIAKGWMAARLGSWLARSTTDPTLLVDAGGDVLAIRGDHRVAVDHGGGTIATLALWAGQAIATSGSSARSWINGDGTAAHHLIDPVTGAPATLGVASVVAADVVTADVLATVVAIDTTRIGRLRRPALVTRPDGCHSTAAWDALAARRQLD